MQTLECTDPLLHYDQLFNTSAIAYADGLDLIDPRVSSLYGDFTKGFSPTNTYRRNQVYVSSTSVRLFQAF